MRTLDPWVALATAASVTELIRLATSVALPVEHGPITPAKSIATLDHLSGGRVTLGAGFGWNTDELTDHGVTTGRRHTMLREYLEAMQALWSEEEASYEGEFVTFGPSWSWPKTTQQPRVPVVIGADGTDKTHQWISRSADGWMTTPLEPEIEDKAPRLRKAWQDAGRDGTPQIIVLAGRRPDPVTLARWEDPGVTEVLLGIPGKPVAGVVSYLRHQAGKPGLPA